MVDDYYNKNYKKLRKDATGIMMKNIHTDEFVDTLVISSYEYIISNQDKLHHKIMNGKLESIIINWMYKQVIWSNTDFKKDFIYKKDISIFDGMDIEDREDDIEDVLEDEFEIQRKLDYITSKLYTLTQVELRLYTLYFLRGYDNSGKLSRYTKIPRTTCWLMIRDLKEKLLEGYE